MGTPKTHMLGIFRFLKRVEAITFCIQNIDMCNAIQPNKIS